MLMRRAAKIALLIFGLLPYITFTLGATIVGLGEKTTNPLFIILGVLTFLAFPGLLIFYIVHVYRGKKVKKDQRHLWAALLLFGNLVVYPVYWYLYVWQKRKKPIMSN